MKRNSRIINEISSDTLKSYTSKASDPERVKSDPLRTLVKHTRGVKKAEEKLKNKGKMKDLPKATYNTPTDDELYERHLMKKLSKILESR